MSDSTAAEVAIRAIQARRYPGWEQRHDGPLAGGKSTDWSPKWLRECLCAQESNVPDEFTQAEIGRLIRLLDLHRPLGSDGKHGTRHTATCGCDLRDDD